MLKRIAKSLRPALVLLAVFITLGFAIIAYQAVRTLQQLTAIEVERDQWQRPSEIIAALNLKPESTVMDLGSGSGYFALKLSPVVGNGGSANSHLPQKADAVLIANTYHELDHPDAILRS